MMMMMGSMSGGSMRSVPALNSSQPMGPGPMASTGGVQSHSVMHALEEARAAAAAAMTAADQARHQVAQERREREALTDELSDIRDVLSEEQRRRERAEHAAAISFDDAEYARELLHEHAVAARSQQLQQVRPQSTPRGSAPAEGGGTNGSVSQAAQATLQAAAEAASLLEELKGGLRSTLEQQRNLQQATREVMAAQPQAPPRVAPARPASPVERFDARRSIPPAQGPGRMTRPSSGVPLRAPSPSPSPFAGVAPGGRSYYRDFGQVPAKDGYTPGLRRAKDHVHLRDDGVGTHGAQFSVAPEHMTANALEAARREYAADKRMALERRRQRMMIDEYGQLAH